MTARTLQDQPYRIFFPLGITLAWVGVGQWLLFGQGVIEAYLSIFHSMVQVQGFLICFAMGFLFTMLPRRTESEPANVATLLTCWLCPIGTTIAAGLELWPLAQAFWLVLLAALASFALPRLLRGARRPPAGFLWIPTALVFGVVGSVITGLGAAVPGLWSLHEIGRGLVLQGMFSCLVIGVGGFAVPLMTRGEAAPDLGSYPESRRDLGLHLLGALLLLASFPLEHFVSLRGGYALRGVTMLAVLLASSRIHRLPDRPGLIRRLLFVAVWCAPLGYLTAALVPTLGKGGLHITFIGGFGVLALAVSSQVILGHGGYERLKSGVPWQLTATAILLILAIAARLLMETRADEVLLWISCASGLFLLATLCWSGLLLPRLFREPHADER